MLFWRRHPKESMRLLIGGGFPFILAGITAVLYGRTIFIPAIAIVWFLLFINCGRRLLSCICGRLLPGKPYNPAAWEGSTIPPMGMTKPETIYLEISGLAFVLSLFFLAARIVNNPKLFGIMPMGSIDQFVIVMIGTVFLFALLVGLKIVLAMISDRGYHGTYTSCPQCSGIIRINNN